jgi:hypothetical protein
MQPHEQKPDGGQPDRPSGYARPPSDQGLKQILAAEDVLEEARTISRRIWKRVRRLIRSDWPLAAGDEGSGVTDPGCRPG